MLCQHSKPVKSGHVLAIRQKKWPALVMHSCSKLAPFGDGSDSDYQEPEYFFDFASFNSTGGYVIPKDPIDPILQESEQLMSAIPDGKFLDLISSQLSAIVPPPSLDS